MKWLDKPWAKEPFQIDEAIAYYYEMFPQIESASEQKSVSSLLVDVSTQADVEENSASLEALANKIFSEIFLRFSRDERGLAPYLPWLRAFSRSLLLGVDVDISHYKDIQKKFMGLKLFEINKGLALYLSSEAKDLRLLRLLMQAMIVQSRLDVARWCVDEHLKHSFPLLFHFEEDSDASYTLLYFSIECLVNNKKDLRIAQETSHVVLEWIQLLCDVGKINPLLTPIEGQTVLYLAVVNENLPAVEALLTRCPALYDVKTNRGELPFHAALLKPEILLFLCNFPRTFPEYNGPYKTSFTLANLLNTLFVSREYVVKRRLKADFLTPLFHILTSFNRYDSLKIEDVLRSIKILFEYGASPTERCEYQNKLMSPLYFIEHHTPKAKKPCCYGLFHCPSKELSKFAPILVELKRVIEASESAKVGVVRPLRPLTT